MLISLNGMNKFYWERKFLCSSQFLTLTQGIKKSGSNPFFHSRKYEINSYSIKNHLFVTIMNIPYMLTYKPENFELKLSFKKGESAYTRVRFHEKSSKLQSFPTSLAN